MDRDQFLSRVSVAVMRSGAPSPSPVPDRLPELEPVDEVVLFRDRAQSVDAVVHGPVSRHGVPKAVTGIAAGHGAETFIAWDDLPIAGIPSALTSAGLNRMEHELPTGNRLEETLALGKVDLGVTGADFGLCESGSVVLSHGEGRPRMASLIPEIHIVLLEVSRIDRTLAHWAAKHPELAPQSTNLVVVTGPSRTGDIEQELNLGVHGPRHLHVVLIR